MKPAKRLLEPIKSPMPFFTPVLDVNSNRTNPVIRVRSFGDIKKKVIEYRYDRRLAEQGH